MKAGAKPGIGGVGAGPRRGWGREGAGGGRKGKWGIWNQLRNRNRSVSSVDGISPPSSSLASGSRPGLRAKEELDLCVALECAG